jgi:hypothetical protein
MTTSTTAEEPAAGNTRRELSRASDFSTAMPAASPARERGGHVPMVEKANRLGSPWWNQTASRATRSPLADGPDYVSEWDPRLI